MNILTNKNDVVILKFENYTDNDDAVKIENSVYKKEQINLYEDVLNIPEDEILSKYKYVDGAFISNSDYIEPEIAKPTIKTKYRKDEFIDLFTDSQWINVLSSENTDTNIKLFLMKFNNAPDGIIDIEKDKVKTSLEYLRDSSYITTEDYDRIYGL